MTDRIDLVQIKDPPSRGLEPTVRKPSRIRRNVIALNGRPLPPSISVKTTQTLYGSFAWLDGKRLYDTIIYRDGVAYMRLPPQSDHVDELYEAAENDER